MVWFNTYEFTPVSVECGQTDRQTDRHTDVTHSAVSAAVIVNWCLMDRMVALAEDSWQEAQIPERRSLRRSRSFKVTNSDTNRKSSFCQIIAFNKGCLSLIHSFLVICLNITISHNFTKIGFFGMSCSLQTMCVYLQPLAGTSRVL